MSSPTSSHPPSTLSRRQAIRGGLGAVGVWAMARLSPAALGLADAADGEVVVPFLDPLPAVKAPQIKWHEAVAGQWLTPGEQVYEVSHYPKPKEVAPADYKLEIGGLVERPATLTLEQLKARPRKEVTLTLECGGNGSNPGFMGAIANVKWAGAPLAPLLREAGVKPGTVEVAFYGADVGKEKIRNFDVEQPFARTLPVSEVARDDILVCYEMNGQPLTLVHGAPVRLVVPGWYGIAWVKWMTRIEARDRRLMTRFIAKDYVTLRLEEENGRQVARETSVGPINVKSIVARVTRRPDGTHVVAGAAWTQGKIAKVELKVDDGDWAAVKLQENTDPHTWTFWTYEWKDAKPGDHTLVSRATDEQGRVQPTKDDPEIKNKRTYWEAYAQYPRRVKVG